MAILTGKEILRPYIKKTTGYIKSLISSQHVEMNNGITLQSTIDGININLIYEEYNSGVWHVRKWNNGFAECFGSITTTQSPYSKYSEFNIFMLSHSLPFQFVTTPHKVYNVQVGNGIAMPASSSMNDTIDKVSFYMLANNIGNQTIKISTYVWGNWK